MEIRRAELMAALSVATDLGMGQPIEQALSGCVLAVRLAAEAGMADAELREVFYQSLLRYIGCNADTHVLASLVGGFRSAIPDLVMTIEQVLEGPHQVVWRFRVRGTQRGELLGTPPSRRQVDIGGIVWSRFENGLWAEDHAQWDALAMMRQIDAQSGISTSSCAASTSA